MDDGTALKTECYPIAVLPGLSRLFLDFAERREALAPFFPASAYSPCSSDYSLRLAGAAEP
jgi:hypothetical protein